MAINEQAILHDLQDEMVQRAERLVRGLDSSSGSGEEAVQKRKTQASKAIEVAQSAGSLSVFVNWLRYQAARKESQEFWGMKTSGQLLASALLENLLWLQKEVNDRTKGEGRSEQSRLTMKAVTQFLGYFRRALVGAEFLKDITLERGG